MESRQHKQRQHERIDIDNDINSPRMISNEKWVFRVYCYESSKSESG